LTASQASGEIPGFKAQPGVAADGAGTTAFQGSSPLQPAPLLKVVVRLRQVSFGRRCKEVLVLRSRCSLLLFIGVGGTEE
jgi:hypothetical protein